MDKNELNQNSQSMITNQPTQKIWTPPQRTKLESSQTEGIVSTGSDLNGLAIPS
jgi:hypothetical protein